MPGSLTSIYLRRRYRLRWRDIFAEYVHGSLAYTSRGDALRLALSLRRAIGPAGQARSSCNDPAALADVARWRDIFAELVRAYGTGERAGDALLVLLERRRRRLGG